jgi:hypothetical protein
MRVQLNVKSIRTWSTAKNAQKHAANVLLSATKFNQLKSSQSRVPLRDSAHEKNNQNY